MTLQLQQKKAEGPEVKKPNLTGIPTQMKLDFERRSGLSFDDVRVHYNSDKPARLGALAYTQGTQIHVGPGQERSLPHELGHVIQQKTGRVRPTRWIGGLPVNDQPELEREADLAPVQCMPARDRQGVIQRLSEEDYLPFSESAAWYASVHDEKVGSIYFEHGRLRLIHSHGPEMSPVRDDGANLRSIRYLIVPNDDRLVRDVQGILKDRYAAHRNGAWREIDEAALRDAQPEVIEGCTVYTLSGKDPFEAIPEAHRERGRLFELFLAVQSGPVPDRAGGAHADGDDRHLIMVKRIASHPSRGSIGKLPDHLTAPGKAAEVNLSVLTFAVKLAQKITQEMTTNFAEGIENPQEHALNFIQELYTAEKAQMPEHSDLAIPLRTVLNKIKNRFETGLTPENLNAAYRLALASGPRLEKQAQRFGGYFGNQAFRASGLIELLELEVDPDD